MMKLLVNFMLSHKIIFIRTFYYVFLLNFKVPFLNFPAQKQMTYMQKKSVYDSYASESKNLMSYASFMVGYLELNEERKAREYMKRQANQFNEPFQVLSEHPSNMMIDNNYNFLPGHASFIQV